MNPHVMDHTRIDTMGYAFAFTMIRWLNLRPITRLDTSTRNVASIPIGAYVHYPTISTDMLNRVKDREVGVTNDASIASSSWKSSLKLLYVALPGLIPSDTQ
jgi:alpha-1,2-mannosyltransferase